MWLPMQKVCSSANQISEIPESSTPYQTMTTLAEQSTEVLSTVHHEERESTETAPSIVAKSLVALSLFWPAPICIYIRHVCYMIQRCQPVLIH